MLTAALKIWAMLEIDCFEKCPKALFSTPFKPESWLTFRPLKSSSTSLGFGYRGFNGRGKEVRRQSLVKHLVETEYFPLSQRPILPGDQLGEGI